MRVRVSESIVLVLVLHLSVPVGCFRAVMWEGIGMMGHFEAFIERQDASPFHVMFQQLVDVGEQVHSHDGHTNTDKSPGMAETARRPSGSMALCARQARSFKFT